MRVQAFWPSVYLQEVAASLCGARREWWCCTPSSAAWVIGSDRTLHVHGTWSCYYLGCSVNEMSEPGKTKNELDFTVNIVSIVRHCYWKNNPSIGFQMKTFSNKLTHTGYKCPSIPLLCFHLALVLFTTL